MKCKSNVRWPVQKAQGGRHGWRRVSSKGKGAGSDVGEVGRALGVSSGVWRLVGRAAGAGR